MGMKKQNRRITAVILSLCMVVAMPGTAAVGGVSADSASWGEYYIRNTKGSGHVESQPCSHTKHTEDCYTDRLICGYILDEEEAVEQTASESDADRIHRHTWECYALDCLHERGEHDETCGYTEGMLDTPNLFAINDRFVAGNISYKEIGPGQAQVIDGKNASGEVEIPETVTDSDAGKSYTVVSIGSKAFSQNKKIKKITFPDTITEIGDYAFWQCENLSGGLVLPQSVQNIGDSAFRQCGKFDEELKLPNSLKSIGALAFSDCGGFTGKLELPATLQVIGNFAFRGCKKFEGDLRLPDNILSIGKEAFQNCSGLDGKLTLSAKLQNIGESAFSGTGFTGDVMLPDSLQSIGKSAFAHTSLKCSATSVKVASLAYSYGYKVYLNGVLYSEEDKDDEFKADNLNFKIIDSDKREVEVVSPVQASGTLIIPETVERDGVTYTVTAIGESAFRGCSGFTGDLELPANIQRIGKNAFEACWGFDGELKLPAEVQSIGEKAFFLCGRFQGELKLPTKLQSIGSSAFEGCKGLRGNLILPDSIENIGMEAFKDCTDISSIHVGSGVMTIGMDAFPANLPLATDSPRVQILLVRYLNMDTLPPASWNGMEDVPPGAIATVDRDITISGKITVGEGAEITISPGATVTVEGELVNNGAIINNGTVTNHGTITIGGSGSMETADGIFNNFGTLDGNGQLPDENSYNHKKAAVKLFVSEENPAYGTDVVLTVAITEEALPKANSLSRLSAETPPKTVFIYCDGKEIGRAVMEDTGEKKATFPIAWENEIWTIGSHIITAKYTGGNDQLLPSESEEVLLEIKKVEQPRAAAPTAKGEPGETTVTLNTQIGQKYLCTSTADTPEIDSGMWERAEEDTLSFSGLAPFTDYYFWTYMPGDAYYLDSPVSPALRITTQKNGEQKAVEEAKRVIEAGVYTVEQANAGDIEALTLALVRQINQLTGMSETGIAVEERSITIGRFNEAKAGDADNPDGGNGSFAFTVALAKGNMVSITESRDGMITAVPFTGKTNAEAVAEVKSAIEGGDYTLFQEDAGSKAALKQVLAGIINGLAEMKRNGITVTEADINLTISKAAVAGNADDPGGTDGSFFFTVPLTKGAASCITERKDGKVVATPYFSSDATLSSLVVTDADLNPAFDPAITNYAASVGYRVSSVTITATASDKRAAVRGDTGMQLLKVGDNVFHVTVTAADGSVATYTVTITRARYSGGSSSSENSGSYNSGGDSGVTVQTSAGPDIPTTGIAQPLTPDKDGTVTMMDEAVFSAISAARQDARNKGNTQNGIAVSIPVKIVSGQTGFRIVISASVLDKLIEEQVTRFDIEAGGMVSYSFPLDALKELRILTEGGGIILKTEKWMELTESARTAVGSRPVYGISLSYMKNGTEVPVSVLSGVGVTVKLPYALLEEETPDPLCAAYVDDAGAVHWIVKSTYDPVQTAMIFEVRYFGIYGIGKKS